MYEILKSAALVCSFLFWASIFTPRTAFMFKERSKTKGLWVWGALCVALGATAAFMQGGPLETQRAVPAALVETRQQAKPTQTVEPQRAHSAPAGDEFTTLYKELLAFKGKKDFHAQGFGAGGPYSSWLVRVNAAGLGDLRQMGMDYMRSKGQETEYTLYVKKEKGLN